MPDQPVQPPSAVGITPGTLNPEPINEFDQSLDIARMAFPTLFPNGWASFRASRPRGVTFREYVRHLMRYKDDRFAQHPRFRWWAFNTLMRNQSRESSKWMWKKLDNRDINIDGLRDLVTNDGSKISEYLVRKAQSLRGTRPYWQRAKTELEAFVYNLGTPSVFFTVSAADFQWYDLYQHMPNNQEYLAASESERHKIAGRLIQQNPHIIAEYLALRFRLLFEQVLGEKFDVSDNWYRFEWQSRGSGHIHGFLWIREAPEVANEMEYLKYWGSKVTAINPGGHLDPAAVHPSSRSFDTRVNNLQQLGELLNRVQRHKCMPQYCLRRDRVTKEVRCRFAFPWPERDNPNVGNHSNPTYRTFEPVRNDTQLGKHNATLILAWLANVDFAPCTDLKSVIHYLAKYTSKEEKKSEKLVDLGTKILDRLPTNNPLLTWITRLYNRMISERDWSAQEVCHLLLDQHLREGSRTVADLNIRPNHEQRTKLQLDNSNAKVEDTWLERYCCRGDSLESESLLSIMVGFNWRNIKGWYPCRKQKVVNLFPRPDQDRNRAGWCRAKVMLHHPFRSIDESDLFDFGDGDRFVDYEEAYDYCLQYHTHYPSDPLGDLLTANFPSSDEELSDVEVNNEEVVEDEALAMRNPHRNGDDSIQTDLGRRPEDLEHDWAHRRFPIDVSATIQHIQAVHGTNNSDSGPPSTLQEAGDPDTLNAEQRDVFDRVLHHYHQQTDQQLLLHVDGEAGTGKSRVIEMISKHLAYHSAQQGRCDPVMRGAPTGVAAHNIQGSTLHRLLSLPVKKKFQELKEEPLFRLQGYIRDRWLLIVDEKSMIGAPTLHYIDRRLRQITCCPELDFGGLNILFCGDFGQLPPVAATALYSTLPSENEEVLAGLRAYKAIEQTIVLTQIMRQQGTSPEAVQFRHTLKQLRDGLLDRVSWQSLVQRTRQRLTPAQWESFHNALRLYATNREVDGYNLQHLESLARPVIKINAINTGKGAKKAAAEDCANLENELLLAEGAKVMLLWNLCVDEGCVNGTMAQVEAIIWADDIQDPLNTIPLMVLVEIEGYAGRASVALNGKNLVPILARTQQWEQDGSTCSRTQIPLALAFAITIHKSQGLTLDQAVVNLDNKKIHMDLTYVALSRVRHITSLAVEACASLDRFPTEQTMGIKMRINDAARRQGLPIPHQITVPSKRKEPKQGRVSQGRPRRRRNELEHGG